MAQLTIGTPSGPKVTAFVEVWVLSILKQLDAATLNAITARAAQMQRDLNQDTKKGAVWTPDGPAVRVNTSAT